MIVYDIANPSADATFLAPDRDIALAALVFMGEGAYGGMPLERDGVKLTDEEKEALRVPIFLFGDYTAWWQAAGYAAEPIQAVLDSRAAEVAAALRSAAYGNLDDRKTYDSACAAIDDPDKLAKFKADCEDRRRSSMNRIVQRAWAMADRIEKRAVAA